MILGSLTGMALLLMGALLSAGGAWLALRGGSPANMVMGVGLLLIGYFMFRRPSRTRQAHAPPFWPS